MPNNNNNEPISAGEVDYILNKAHQEYSDGGNPRIELNDEQVNYLAAQAREGNGSAREVVIIWANRLIAPHPAHIQWIKYASVSPEDMWQEGRIAVMTAIDKYDISRGYDFGAYCARIVSNTLGEWAERHSLVISVPRHARRRLRREGVVDETTALAKAAEQLPRYLSSLLSPSGEDNSSRSEGLISTLADKADDSSPELELEARERAGEVRRAFYALDPLEQEILYHRYILEMSIEKVHKLKHIGLTTLRGIEEEALTHLSEELEAYLYEDT